MLRLVKVYLVLCGLLWFLPAKALDQEKIDSLTTALTTADEDSLRIQLLQDLFVAYVFEDPKSATQYAAQALTLSKEMNDAKLIGQSHHHLGYIHYIQGSYDEALSQWLNALNYRKQASDKKGISQSLGNVGIIYKLQGNITMALSYYLEALKMDEELGNESGVARHLSNIGVLYWTQGEREKALDYYTRSLNKYLEIEEESGAAFCYGNMGIIYADQGDYDKALFHHQKALEIDLKMNKMKDVARHYGNIGIVHEKQGNYDRALEYFFKDFEINKQLGSIKSMAASSGNIGSAYLHKKDYSLAEKYLQKAAHISDSLRVLKLMKDHQALLYQLYKEQNKPNEALKYYENFVAAKDSLINEKNTENIIRQQMQFNFSKIKLQDSLEFAKQQAIKDLTIKEQDVRIENERLQKYLLFGGTGLILIFAVVFYQKLKQTRKQNLIIEEQKLKVEKQKDTIEAHNKEILDSINYAKLIQQALLKSEEHVSKHLPPHFIFFKPKDIVSGDFYWAHEREDHLYFCVADCTGHGVPGAMMSMLGISFLTEIISHNKLPKPNEILTQLRDKTINELSQSSGIQTSKDGMDIALVRLNLKTNELQYAGANNPLYYIQNGELFEIKADKQPIGYYTKMSAFTNHELQLQPGNSLYLFSDGFADQFGGDKGKKYKYKRFKEFIVEHHKKDHQTQKTLLAEEFLQWKKDYVQVDDVCVIGMTL